MDVRNNYLFGTDIDLNKYNLGVIHQPKYEDLMKYNMDISDFIKVFYLSEVFNYRYNSEINNLGSIAFLMMMDLQDKESKLLESLKLSLEIIYKTENIRFIDHIATFVVDEKIVIDKENFDMLCKIVLEMTKTNIDYKELNKKPPSDDELLNEFERRKKEYEEKHPKKNSEISFVDILNTIIHYQNNIDYNKILGWTIYQIKNTYEVLVAKESNYISLFRQASMKFDIPEVANWQNYAKLNKTKMDK